MSETPQGLLAPGGMFGDFRVRKELGRGGMGMVYLLEDEETGANYAAKILYPEAEIRDHKDAVGRFLREAEIAMAVEHPNLVHVYAVGRDPETRLGYMIMDYLPGGSLHDLIMERLVRKQGPLPVRQSVALVRQIASALCAVERNGVVHRDIKSENILFDEEGVAKLTDLGIAKRTNAGPKDVTLTLPNVMIGTPAYMSPEHLMDSKKVDIRSDIYSLGIVLWEMLAGEPPNAGLTTSELIDKVYGRAIDAEYPSEEKANEMINAVTKTKDNVDAYFINSGAADCDQLKNIYASKVEESKEDLEALRKIVAVFSLLNCTESDVYYTAAEYAHNIEPTAGTAAGCAYSYFKRGNVDKSLEYFDQAISLEEDNAKKAEYNYKAAVIANSDKKYSRAKSYCKTAIGLNGRKGSYYILLANIYAAAPNWSDKPELNPCKYYAVLDKLNRAKAVDESVAAEANRLIGIYKEHTPDPANLFFLGIKQGDTVHVGGLIDEDVTVR